MKFITTKMLLIFLGVCFMACSGSKVKIYDLTTEGMKNPLGLESKNPRFSWKLSSPNRNLLQTHYQIIVSSNEDNLKKEIGDLWDSGKIESSESLYIPYAGKELVTDGTYYWAVKIWTNQGETTFSESKKWSMALLSPTDWKAKWIGIESVSIPNENRGSDDKDAAQKGKNKSRLSARYLRKEIDINKEIKSAYWHISGMGLNYSYVNGEITGDYVMAPMPSVYTKTVYYNTFDVKDLLKQGRNTLGVILGNGRFFGMRIPGMRSFGLPKLLSQLDVEYTDGTSEKFISDDTWKAFIDGPIQSNNEFDGETYDAMKEIPGWNENGFDDSAWLAVDMVEAPLGKVKAQENPNLKTMDIVKPLSINKLHDGRYVMDMGQNMVGWLQMKVKGKAGDQVKLRFVEVLNEDGTPDFENLRTAEVTDLYTLKGDSNGETWEPKFVVHGFRFVEISGYPGEPTIEDFLGKVVYDEMETIGQFETMNKTINQIHKNAFWGIRGNYRGMPMDCPQRDERLGWLGDRTTGAYGESFIFNNNNLYAKWLQDIRDTQKDDGIIADIAPNYWSGYSYNMTWPAAYLFVAEMLYNQFGDRQPIENNYDSFKAYMEVMKDKHMKDYILTRDVYGDWCMPPEDLSKIHASDPNRQTDGEVISTAYYYYMSGIMQRFAILLNKSEDIKYYDDLKKNIREAFNQKFYNEADKTYSNNTITANLLAVMCGLVDEQHKEDVFLNIVNKTKNEYNNHVSSGVIGIQWLMRGLTENGYPDLAYTLATNTDYPSWGYMAENGATTIWELWNGNTADKHMNSKNHVMLLGDLIIWYYENLAGIKSAIDSQPAFKNIIMKPLFINGLDYVNAEYESARGNIISSWNKANNKFSWTIVVPGNSTATVYLPYYQDKIVKEGGKDIDQLNDIKVVNQNEIYTVVEIGSGEYYFTIE